MNTKQFFVCPYVFTYNDRLIDWPYCLRYWNGYCIGSSLNWPGQTPTLTCVSHFHLTRIPSPPAYLLSDLPLLFNVSEHKGLKNGPIDTSYTLLYASQERNDDFVTKATYQVFSLHLSESFANNSQSLSKKMEVFLATMCQAFTCCRTPDNLLFLLTVEMDLERFVVWFGDCLVCRRCWLEKGRGNFITSSNRQNCPHCSIICQRMADGIPSFDFVIFQFFQRLPRLSNRNVKGLTCCFIHPWFAI